MVDQSLLDLAAPLWSARRTHAALGIGEDTAYRWRRDGRLLGVTPEDGLGVRYPVRQFETVNGRVRVKPALAVLFAAAAGVDPWTLVVVMQTPALELDGSTPLEWADAGRAPVALMRLGDLVRMEVNRR